jgi:hypothetical protein
MCYLNPAPVAASSKMSLNATISSLRLQLVCYLVLFCFKLSILLNIVILRTGGDSGKGRLSALFRRIARRFNTRLATVDINLLYIFHIVVSRLLLVELVS